VRIEEGFYAQRDNPRAIEVTGGARGHGHGQGRQKETRKTGTRKKLHAYDEGHPQQ
jgi:hypothetical protein